MEKLEKAGAGFLSPAEAVDTTSPAGRMMMQIVGSFAEFERAMLSERTRSGLLAARGEGRIDGRPSQAHAAGKKGIIHLINSGQKTGTDSARLFNVHVSTMARLLARSKLVK